MKTLLIGATGLLGHALWRDWSQKPGWSVQGTSLSLPIPGLEALDVLDRKALQGVFDRIRPEATVLLASDPFVDGCQADPKRSRPLNVDAACAAAEEARRVGSTFVFFSSDYVFDGAKAPYCETDPVGPLNEYGKQKVEAEAGIARACPDHLILRISGLFGWELRRKNFVLQVLDRLDCGSDLVAAEDIRYHPTYAPNLSEVTAELLENGCRGVYHAVGADEHSRYDFARLVAEVFGLDGSKIKKVRQAELKLPAPRPANSSLSTQKLAGAVSAPLWGARQALEHMRDTRKDWEAYAASLGTLDPCGMKREPVK